MGCLTGTRETLRPARPCASWQGPSPLPWRHADPRPAGGPKPPASARPAPGGRFSPAGPGAGLCWCGLRGSWWQRRARARETQCVSCSRPDWGRKNIVRTASRAAMAGAIAPATVPRRSLASRGPKAPGQRPAGRFAPAGSGTGLRCACGSGPRGAVVRGRARKRGAFPSAPGMPTPFSRIGNGSSPGRRQACSFSTLSIVRSPF